MIDWKTRNWEQVVTQGQGPANQRDQVKASTNSHTYPVALLCLATGARWEKAESLTRGAVHGGKVHYHRTKNRQSRSVPIPDELERLIFKVGMPGSGRLFMSCRAAFRCAYQRCGFQTPGQMTHILRHTFASHYMMGGRGYPDPTADPRPLIDHDDHAVCAPIAGASGIRINSISASSGWGITGDSQ